MRRPDLSLSKRDPHRGGVAMRKWVEFAMAVSTAMLIKLLIVG
jgi:hypothetical protein